MLKTHLREQCPPIAPTKLGYFLRLLREDLHFVNDHCDFEYDGLREYV